MVRHDFGKLFGIFSLLPSFKASRRIQLLLIFFLYAQVWPVNTILFSYQFLYRKESLKFHIIAIIITFINPLGSSLLSTETKFFQVIIKSRIYDI